MTTTTTILFLLLQYLPHTVSWGPFTHQYFASLDATYHTSLPFITGGSSPDAVKKLENALHTFTFAAALYETATSSNTSSDIEFALGYGCHLAHDYVGHHAKGFLNPLEDHPLEFAVDTYVETLSNKPSFNQLTSAMEALIAKTSRSASSVYPFISKVSLTQVQSSVGAFKKLTTAEHLAIQVNKLFYKSQLVKDSYCNISHVQDAVLNFKRATNWSISACNFWKDTMQNSGVNGTEAQTMVEKYVDGIFAAHEESSC